MATFPAREHALAAALRSLEPQVDELHLVLNEYPSIPGFLAKMPKVNPILPDEDHKDVGKFVTTPGPEDHVFLVDDDLFYPPSYCDWMSGRAEAIGLERALFGLHACIYRPSPGAGAKRERTLHYRKGLRRSLVVDQIGTGTAFGLGKYMPSLQYMRGSQMFVDVRFAKWCFENGWERVSLARPFNFVRPLRPGGSTIYQSVTRNTPPHVIAEIRGFARKSKLTGRVMDDGIGFFQMLFGAGSRGSS